MQLKKALNIGTDSSVDLYNKASEKEIKGTFELDGRESVEQLDHIRDELLIRIKITKQEIFKIGELLVYAKHVCQESGQGYEDWIKDNFDFSLKTANNFVNVFEQCMGIRDVAILLPTSILYQISAPSFPKELKDYLITNGNLEKMTNGHFKKLTQKFKEGGFEAIEPDMKEINHTYTMKRHTQYTLDMCENAYRVLDDLRKKINQRSKQASHDKPFDVLEESDEINSKLLLAIEDAGNILFGAINESKDILKQIDINELIE
jgi:hypothetical protein